MGATDVRYDAVWTVNEYDVSFWSDDAELTEQKLTLEYGAEYTLPAAPVKTGYTFGGWKSGDQTYEAGSKQTVGATDVRYDAVWTVNEYELSFVTGTEETIAAKTVNFNGRVQLPVPAERTGHTFGGWSDGTDLFEAGSFYTMGAADAVLTAVWNPDPHTVTYDNAGVTSTQKGTYGQTLMLDIPLDKEGYTFGGWSDGTNTYQAGADFVLTEDVTLRAIWNKNSYTISVEGEHASVTIDESAEFGATVNFTVAAENGYTVQSVKLVTEEGETDLTGAESFTMPAGNVKLVVSVSKTGGCGSRSAEASATVAGVLALCAAALFGKRR